MKQPGLVRFLLAGMAALILALSLPLPGWAAQTGGGRRFNVAVVMDASGSILDTDPEGYRYQALSQFVFYLAQEGNTLGGVVFNNDVLGGRELAPIRSQEEKQAAVDALASIPAGSGWTNTGAALDRAVAMLREDGDPALPSVILFFSDGNTAMGTEQETRASLDLKEEAIQAARESGIAIYSICLNADRTADISEMQQLSQATGGVCQEVASAKDLQPVFQSFYDLIYGTLPEKIDTHIPDSGYLETPFDVPGIGVEEVNITIYGTASQIKLLRPDGGEEDSCLRLDTSVSTMLKQPQPQPGTWTLVTQGVPGSSIEVDLVYNTDLGIEVETDPAGDRLTAGVPWKVAARLTGSGTAAEADGDYAGFSARLDILDAYGDPVAQVPMAVSGGRFRGDYRFAEGSYYYEITVTGNHMERSTGRLGPLTATAAGAGEENTPPVPVDEVVEARVNIWPFKGGRYTLDLNTLATDAEDSRLRYRIVSSSFLEGSDYRLDAGGVLTMDHFSLHKGAFTVEATDSGGLSCRVEVVVRAVDIGLLALLGMGALALAGAAVCAALLYIALNKPFRGTISAQSYCNGQYRGVPRTPRRGRCKLAAFGMDNVGLDYQKSYFQATGKDYIELCTNVPVFYNGRETKKVRINSGMEVTIPVRQGDPRLLYVRFDSRMAGMRPSAPPRKPRRSGARR